MSVAAAAPAPRGTIRLEEVAVAYRGELALESISGEFTAGSLTAILGPNGAGKTSLLAAIAGAVPLASGRLDLDRSARVAYLPQRSQIDLGFPIRVIDVVALGLTARIGPWRGLDRALRAEARQALAAVGVAGLERNLIGELSAGQFRRVLFARTLLEQADIVLLDEPFNAVDARTTADLIGLIGTWQRQGRTVLAVLHQEDLVRAYFPRALLLARRVIAWGPTAEVLGAEPQERARRAAAHWEERVPAGALAQ
jgi:zinc/manganese transport system ATP-binding protein